MGKSLEISSINSTRSPGCGSPLMNPYSCLELGMQVAIARGHGLYLLHAAVGKHVENKLGSCSQWGNELFESQVFVYRKERNKFLALLEVVLWCLLGHRDYMRHIMFFQVKRRSEFLSIIGNCISIS
jgi:hypothetical protein